MLPGVRAVNGQLSAIGKLHIGQESFVTAQEDRLLQGVVE
jgi:hypothetical protein